MSTQQENEKMAVAREIVRQLQVLPVPRMGFSFLALTGAHKFAGDENSVRFNIKHSNKRMINTIKITLNGNDLYDIEFWNCRLLKKAPYVVNEKVDQISDIFFDQLPGILAEKVELS